MITPEVIAEGLRLDAERTPGEWNTGGTFDPDGKRPTQWIWPPPEPGAASAKYEIARGLLIKDAKFVCHAEHHYADALRAASRVQELENLLRDMIDPETCHYDHNDFCQEHYCDRPCKHEQAKAALGIEVGPR